MQLFGCDFTSLWQIANQKRCHALLRAGKLAEVFEAYQYMADMSDEATRASCLNWSISTSFRFQQCLGFNLYQNLLRFYERIEHVPEQCS